MGNPKTLYEKGLGQSSHNSFNKKFKRFKNHISALLSAKIRGII